MCKVKVKDWIKNKSGENMVSEPNFLLLLIFYFLSLNKN